MVTTITNPASNSALSSATVRTQLQNLENKIGTPVFDEVPTGSGTAFTLAHTPVVGFVRLYRGGGRITVANGDYTISGASITLTTTLGTNETLTADYNY